MTRFCLVRHGETDWNLQGRYQGQSGEGLNATGFLQAQTLAACLKPHTFASIYSSDLQRAVQTAEIIAKALGLTVQTDPRLREICLGDWEGKEFAAIQSTQRELWQQRLRDPAHFRPPGGENVLEVAQRVHLALKDITTQYLDSNVLVVSHGLAIATAICTSKKVPLAKAYEFIPQNTTPFWIDWDKS